ncbi:MAG: chemotaxis protein CheW [Patescibacteria group bacterium]|nr:chemotaxis protein CheW [Patescibacteria group bacterium]
MIYWEKENRMPPADKKYISFAISGAWYLMPLPATLSFVRYDRVLPLPALLPIVLGLAYQNGQLITVLSGHQLLSGKTKTQSELYLVFKKEEELFALAVDEGGQIIKIRQVFKDAKAKIFKNYIKHNKEKFYILEPEKIFEQLGL